MTESDPATARKRRKEIMQSLRAGDAEGAAENKEAADQQDDALPPKKRRVTAKNRNKGGDNDKNEEKSDKGEEGAAVAAKQTAKQTKNGKKTQIRYDPDVPMSKEQLAAWRREARRVRNRESAAASRQRIRDRISELEEEVGQWKAKYDQAMARLQQVEQMAASSSSQQESF